MYNRTFHLRGRDAALNLFGPYDSNLHMIEERFPVRISARGNAIIIKGSRRDVDAAAGELQQILNRLGKTYPGRPAQFESAQHPSPRTFGPSRAPDLRDGAGTRVPGFWAAAPNASLSETAENFAAARKAMPAWTAAPGEILVTVRGKPVRPQTDQQKKYAEAMESADMVVAVGPAGTGKTFLAVAEALAALRTGRVNRVILSRPVVEAGEKLGFLPGDFYEKVNPYLRPLYDAFWMMIGPDELSRMKADGAVEIVPLAYMRGRTLEDAFIILDEAQNTSPEQMKMFLTRFGSGSKVVVTGDITQIDLENKAACGLLRVIEVLHAVPEIKFVYFSEEDVLRHGLVKKIIRAWDHWEKRRGRKKK